MAKRILVVDDGTDIRRLVAEALEVTGYDVQTAANGGEAILVRLRCTLPTRPPGHHDARHGRVHGLRAAAREAGRTALADHLPHRTP